ncbi:MAG: PH domain-containing protein [Myxococcota bacterium]|nr:PH domain-containing protein [Myxococcota bacterium]
MLESLVVHWLRVPSEPTPPAGDAGSLQVFRAAPNYFRYRQAVWALKQLAALGGLIAGLLFITLALPQLKHGELIGQIARVAEPVAWVLFLIQLPFTYAVLRLDYRLRWYLVTDRSLRVREGIVSVREKTMTFANIQQLSVEQGPLQRLLGLADVKVQSAGGGSGHHPGEQPGTESPHEARFRGVANAAEIRDLVRERVRSFRDAGLGDTDDPVATSVPAAQGNDAVAAAQELLAEVRGLRRTLAQ